MQLMNNNQQQTMTSREIAELVESRHDTVKKSIDRLVDNHVIAVPPSTEYLDSLGRKAMEYRINKRDSYVIVAQLSPAFTAKLVDRWQELESGAVPAFQVPTTLAGALRLAAEQAEQIEAQALAIEAAKPAVDFVERYVESDSGSMGFRQVCKLLEAKEPDFRKFLAEEKIMYRLGGSLAPYAQHIDAGRFEVKAGTANDHAYTQSKFTAKGVNWVAGEYAKYKLKDKS